MKRSQMSVMVVERAAAYRRGLEDALAVAQYRVAASGDPTAWAGEHPNRLVILTLGNAAACKVIEEVAATGGTVVALLPEPTADAFSHALRHGAIAAVDWNADPADIVAVVAAAASGSSLLPAEIVNALAKRGSNAHAPLIEPEEIAWLEALAQGVSVVELAEEVGYSERSMFRKLHELYGRLGVTNRTSALLEAERLGLLPPHRGHGPAA